MIFRMVTWSDCIGIPCQMGRQQRIRTCLKQSFDVKTM